MDPQRTEVGNLKMFQNAISYHNFLSQSEVNSEKFIDGKVKHNCWLSLNV